MADIIFYETTIGGHRFQGIMSGDGPAIRKGEHGVALGRATSIRLVGERMEAEATTVGGAGLLETEILREVGMNSWWIVKYRTQRRVPLLGLCDRDRTQLATEFGIDDHEGDDELRAELFFASSAFKGLAQWVRAHPKRARDCSRFQSYLVRWYERASE